MTMIDKAEALLPCPLCGGKAAYKEYTGEYQNRVFCTACPLEMWGTWLEDPSILAAWNRRALPARGVGVDAVAVKNAVMGWVWAEDSDVSKRLGPKHTDALIARILAALAPTDAAQPTTEKGGDAFENRNPDRPNPATSPGVTAGADAAQTPFRVEDMTLADLMRDPLYEAATAPASDAAQAREAAMQELIDAYEDIIDYAPLVLAKKDQWKRVEAAKEKLGKKRA